MSSEAPRPSRARAERDQVEQSRRRRRDPNDNGMTKRLAVPEHKLDRSQYVYRWVNDVPGRIQRLYGQDWDLVSDEELGNEMPTERHADVAQNRVALNARLMRKPKQFFEEDHKAIQDRIDSELKAAELGRRTLNGPDGEGLSANDPRVYTPRDANNKLG